MRVFWALSGSLSLILGLIGIVLPFLPTVPFVLLAAFCFARSSPAAHRWLTTHRIFGPMIDDWAREGAINPRAKKAATLSIAAVFGISIALGVPALAIGIQAVVLGCVLLFIWTRPDGS